MGDNYSTNSKNNFLDFAKNTVVNGEAVEVLKSIPDCSFDLVFADPPYNLQLKNELHRPDNSRVDGVDEEWDSFESYKAYDEFCENWLKECKRIIKPTGSMWVIGSYHNIFRVGAIMQNLGLWMLNDIIWRKVNPMPNFRGTRFTNAHETLIWAAKDANTKSYKFNYEVMKNFNEGVQMRSDWYLPICNGNERLKGDDNKKLHPTQKPESLLYRIILSSTDKDDFVLDPFFGTGTTGVVAKKLGRNFLGIERDIKYAKAAQQRVDETEYYGDNFIETIKEKRKEPRVPFGSLIDMGIIKPGSTLYSPTNNYKAKVRADGSLSFKSGNGEKASGSIHQMGAHVQGAQACNGWTYWHIKYEGKLLPIDHLRQQVRSQFY